MKNGILLVALFSLLVIGASGYGQADLKIDNIRSGDINAIGFELPSETKVSINAIGYAPKSSRDYLIYGWIIDHNTHEPIWVQGDSRGSRVKGSRDLREVSEEITMPAGSYELYFYAVDHNNSGSFEFFNMLGKVFNNKYDEEDLDDALDECYISLKFDGNAGKNIKRFDPEEIPDGPLLKYVSLGDEENIRQGFELSKATDLKIYSVFEYPDGNHSPVDYGWISEAGTRKKVWTIRRRGSRWAGGGEKNRYVDEVINLPAGKYVLQFVTDGSHSMDGFNVKPPYDPFHWGITIDAVNKGDRSSFTLYKEKPRPEPLLSFTRARDDDYYEQAFKLKKDASILVYCIGEYSDSDREFADYGWIADAATDQIVWEMEYRDCEHAGGGDKNMMFEGTINLKAGDYIVGYMTDGSHSYRSWNSSPPFDQKSYGISLFPVNEADRKIFSEISKTEVYKDSDILAKIVRVGNRAHKEDHFELDKPTRVRIFAVGEGSSGEMYDYGWIEDSDRHRTVWEMTYRNTEPAGGAKKNRLFDDEVFLDAGKYTTVYVSDGSHSFQNWNDSRPRNPTNWGIIVKKSK